MSAFGRVKAACIAGAIIAVGLHHATLAQEEESDSAARFGSPDAVENTIADDSQIRGTGLATWFELKDRIAAETGITFALDYTALYLGSDTNAKPHEASGGIARFYGSWDLVNREGPNTGAVVFKVENRHRISNVAPGGWGLGNLGYVGVIAGPYSNQNDRWSNLYWRQRMNDGRATVIAGYLDVTDYFDTFIGGSPWTGFTNLVFSAGSASAFLPNEATVGIGGATMLGENFYVIGGITNAFSDPTSPFKNSFGEFFSGGEHFKSIEIGWTPSQDQIYSNNTHVTFWHVDTSMAAGTAEGWGVAFSHVRQVGNWTPFLRGGFADKGGSLLQKSVSVGTLYQPSNASGQFGIGVNWGEVNTNTFAPGLDDQVTVEVFYRADITPQLSVTPRIEFVSNPALSAVDGDFWILGVRARLNM